MHAQVIRSRRGLAGADSDRIVLDELTPAFHEEPGFAGALSFVDRQSGDSMLVVLWKTAEQARRPLAARGQVTVWEVNVRV
jgi:hypothetical protein